MSSAMNGSLFAASDEDLTSRARRLMGDASVALMELEVLLNEDKETHPSVKFERTVKSLLESDEAVGFGDIWPKYSLNAMDRREVGNAVDAALLEGHIELAERLISMASDIADTPPTPSVSMMSVGCGSVFVPGPAQQVSLMKRIDVGTQSEVAQEKNVPLEPLPQLYVSDVVISNVEPSEVSTNENVVGHTQLVEHSLLVEEFNGRNVIESPPIDTSPPIHASPSRERKEVHERSIETTAQSTPVVQPVSHQESGPDTSHEDDRTHHSECLKSEWAPACSQLVDSGTSEGTRCDANIGKGHELACEESRESAFYGAGLTTSTRIENAFQQRADTVATHSSPHKTSPIPKWCEDIIQLAARLPNGFAGIKFVDDHTVLHEAASIDNAVLVRVILESDIAGVHELPGSRNARGQLPLEIAGPRTREVIRQFMKS